MTDLASVIIGAIEGWQDGREIDVGMVDDGDGYYDFMGLKVLKPGRDEIRKIVKDWLDANRRSED